jgi:hypothetical protein
MPGAARWPGDDAAVTRARVPALLLLAWLAAAAPAADAAIPAAERVRGAVATANSQAGRARPLWLDVAVTDEAGAVAATGRLALEPRGSSRLELRLADGRGEVHERDPDGYRVTRDGVRVERALPLLPPNQLLQAGTAEEVAAALVALGGDPERVDLGLDQDSDCWVLGGRDPGPFAASDRPSLWFDLAARRPVRIDAGFGTRYRFGPPARQANGFFPAWIEVEAPGWPIWRVQIQSVAETPGVETPAAAR